MNEFQDLLPLREPTFLILLSLSAGPRHGYAIMKEVESLSEGRVLLSTGTLYGALQRLLDQGWIRRTEDLLPNDSGRERKAYELSEPGHKVLAAEVARLEKLVQVARTQTIRDAR